MSDQATLYRPAHPTCSDCLVIAVNTARAEGCRAIYPTILDIISRGTEPIGCKKHLGEAVDLFRGFSISR
jgi:hypothetical protein